MAKLTKNKIKKAIPNSGGVISHIADACNVSWHTVRNFIEAEGHEEIKRMYENEKESVLDFGESKLYEAVDRCEPWAVSLLLKTKGKNRGYTEKQEIDMSANINEKVTIIDDVSTKNK